jgi:hypothetical protein
MKILLELDRIKSRLFSLKKWDWIKATILSALSAISYAVITKASEMLGAGVTPNWKDLSIAALSGFFAYLLKNFFSNSAGLPMPEPKPQTNETPNAPDAGGNNAGL